VGDPRNQIEDPRKMKIFSLNLIDIIRAFIKITVGLYIRLSPNNRSLRGA